MMQSVLKGTNMKKKAIAMVGLAVAAGCAMSMGAASTALAATSANNIKASNGAAVYKVNAIKGGSYNLDNKGAKEKISFTYTKSKDVSDAYTGMKMKVDGKTVTVAKKSYFYEPKVTFIRTADKTGFISITALGENDYTTISKIYRYKDGAIESKATVDALGYFKVFEEYGNHFGAEVSGVKGNDFVFSVATQFAQCGQTSFKYQLFEVSESKQYEPAKEAVKAKASFTKISSAGQGAKAVTWSPITKNVQLYKDANTTKKSTTLKKGAQAKIIGVNITPHYVPTLQVQTKSGTKGWIKCTKKFAKTALFEYATFAG